MKTEKQKGSNLNLTTDGLTGYDILKLPGCPITLPSARSMTQARIDYEQHEADLFNWYNDVYQKTIITLNP